MYLHQVRLQNIACFEDITLDFTDDNGDPCRWVVLLGENGVGKSTAIQAIAGALPTNPEQGHATSENMRTLIRKNHDNLDVALTVTIGSDDEFYERVSSFNTSLSLSKRDGLNTGVLWMPTAFIPGGDYNKGDDVKGWFAAGYRPWRGGKRFVEISSSTTSYAVPAPKAERFDSIFDDYSHLTSIRAWLSDLDYRQLKESGAEQKKAEKVLNVAIAAIQSVLPNSNFRFSEITSTKDVIFEENGLRVSIDSLSDGYRSAMAWIGDLTRRLVEAFPDKENPLEAQGVVLVDEIDLHLHPKWQRTIVSQIRKVFPNLQFIVTTHSPFIAQDMTENDKLIVLKREGDYVTVTEDKGFVSGWRADQILTSYLFGLDSTRNTDIETAEAERSTLLSHQAQSGLSLDERVTLDRVNAFLVGAKSAPDEVIVQTNGVTPTEELNASARALLDLMAKQLDKQGEPA